MAERLIRAYSKSLYTSIIPFSSLAPIELAGLFVNTTFMRFGRGRNLAGSESQVLRPIMTALNFIADWAIVFVDYKSELWKKQFLTEYSELEKESGSFEVVTSAKCFISLGILGHGS